MPRALTLAACLCLASCDGGAHDTGLAVATGTGGSRGRVAVPAAPTPPTVVLPAPQFAFPLLPSTERAEQLAVGGAHGCLLRASGEVACWGRNQWGELGDGTTTSRTSPVRVVGLPPAVEVTVGMAHSCARVRNGDVWCWGYDALAQIGAGTRETSRPPTRVLGRAIAVRASGVSTCAVLDRAGAARCWGSMPATADSALGPMGSIVTLMTPTDVGVAMTEVVSNTQRACALRPDASVVCWGEGSGTSAMVFGPRSGPTRIAGLGPVHALAAGQGWTCGATERGVACFGAHIDMYFGASVPNETTSVAIDGFGPTVALAAGDGYVCGLDASGVVSCAGIGELIDARGWSVPLGGSARAVAAITGARSISMSSTGGCTIDDRAVVHCVLWRPPNWDVPPGPPS